MKFKKSDVGLYFATGLMGGGFGVLIGAFVASRVANRRHVEEMAEFAEDVTDTVEEVLNEYESPTVGSLRNGRRKSRAEVLAQRKREESMAERHGRWVEEVDKDREEREAFIATHELTNVQAGMLRGGVMSVEEMQANFDKQKEAELAQPYNYSLQYKDDKPDLEELVEEIEPMEDLSTIDDQFVLYQVLPEGERVLKEYYYDPEDDSFYTYTRQGAPIPIEPRMGIISDECWISVYAYLMAGRGPIYVIDFVAEPAKTYRFDLVPEELEDDPDSNDVPL